MQLKAVTLVLSLLLNAVLAVALWLTWEVSEFRPRLSPDIHHDALVSLRYGAECGSIVRALGYPLFIKPRGVRDVDVAKHEGPWPDDYVWVYASPGVWESLSIAVVVRNCSLHEIAVSEGDQLVYEVSAAGTEVHSEDLLRTIPD